MEHPIEHYSARQSSWRLLSPRTPRRGTRLSILSTASQLRHDADQSTTRMNAAASAQAGEDAGNRVARGLGGPRHHLSPPPYQRGASCLRRLYILACSSASFT